MSEIDKYFTSNQLLGDSFEDPFTIIELFLKMFSFNMPFILQHDIIPKQSFALLKNGF